MNFLTRCCWSLGFPFTSSNHPYCDVGLEIVNLFLKLGTTAQDMASSILTFCNISPSWQTEEQVFILKREVSLQL